MSEKKTTVRLDDDLRLELRLACAQRDTTQSDAIVEGLRLWLQQGQLPQPGIDANLTRDQRKLLSLFTEMLVTGGGEDKMQRDVAGLVERSVRVWAQLRREVSGE